MGILANIDLAAMAINQLQKLLSNKLQVAVRELQTVGGGCINQTYKIITADKTYFCKVNSASKFPQLFQKERTGLLMIEKQGIINTPIVADYFIDNDYQILILEWIEEGSKNNQFWKLFGEQLALLHHVRNQRFGLEEDNFMGSVPQSNRQHISWISFFIEERLQPLVIACRQKYLLSANHADQFQILYQQLPKIFNDENPSLLHGDLWSGNFICDKESQPVLIDPAVYFGHRSTDLAMTTLFGGFDKSFYEAYHYHYPFPGNYKEQWEICNLYPLLIHLLLFGKSYLSQIRMILDRFD